MPIDQKLLFQKLIQLCKIRGWDTNKIDQRGMCVGLDIFQGYQCHILGKEEDFFTALEQFADWDEQEETLTLEVEKAAAAIFNYAQWLQWGRKHIPIKRQLCNEKLLEMLTGLNNADTPAVKQKFFMGYVLNREEFTITLQKILKPRQITLISSPITNGDKGHDIEVSYHENHTLPYHLYDTEYTNGRKQEFATLAELITAIIRSLFPVTQPQKNECEFEDIFLKKEKKKGLFAEKPNKNPELQQFPLIIEVLSNQNNITYPQAIALIKEFVAKRNELNVPGERGTTSLALAAFCGDATMVKFLIEQGAQTNIVDHLQRTAFISAIQSGDLATVELLYSTELSINPTLTPLCQAAMIGYFDIIDFLFKRKNDKYFVNSENGFFPLLSAIQFGHITVVKYFIEEGKIPVNQEILADDNKFLPLYIAAARGQLEIVRYLLAQGAEINKANAVNDTALCIAAQNGHLLVVKCLIENGAETNPTKAGIGRPLYLALSQKHFDVVDYLLTKGEKLNGVDAKGKTLLENFNEDFNIIDYLIKNDKTIDSKIIVAAYHNASNKNLLAIQIILKQHPVIAFIETALEKIAVLKQKYQGKAFVLSFLDNSGQNIQKEKKLRNYEKGLEKFAESFLQNPLQDINELVKGISELSDHLSGKVKQLITDLSQDRQAAIDKVKLQISGQSVSMTKP